MVLIRNMNEPGSEINNKFITDHVDCVQIATHPTHTVCYHENISDVMPIKYTKYLYPIDRKKKDVCYKLTKVN